MTERVALIPGRWLSRWSIHIRTS